jgi:hypothetical protein
MPSALPVLPVPGMVPGSLPALSLSNGSKDVLCQDSLARTRVRHRAITGTALAIGIFDSFFVAVDRCEGCEVRFMIDTATNRFMMAGKISS